METRGCFIVVMLIICYLTSESHGQLVLRISPKYHDSGLISDGRRFRDDTLYCDSWRFTVETNDAGPWYEIPKRCSEYVKDYVTGYRYKFDSEAVGADALSFIRATNFSGDGTDAWVFDIDETLLSNLPYYADHGFGYASVILGSYSDSQVYASKTTKREIGIWQLEWGPFIWGFSFKYHRTCASLKEAFPYTLQNIPFVHRSEVFDEKSFDEWVELAKAPALPASLKLYKEVEQAGIKIFLLTGRSESQRNATEKNLAFAGYSNWVKLILRGASDLGKPAIVYKSAKRKEIEEAGYVIYGNSGDQWSDLNGFSEAVRSFKLPNPLYFIA